MLRLTMLLLACFTTLPSLACEEETDWHPEEAEEVQLAPADDEGPELLARAQAAWRAYLAHLAEHTTDRRDAAFDAP